MLVTSRRLRRARFSELFKTLFVTRLSGVNTLDSAVYEAHISADPAINRFDRFGLHPLGRDVKRRHCQHLRLGIVAR